MTLHRKWLRRQVAVISEPDAHAAACSCPQKKDWPERRAFSWAEAEELMKENDPGPIQRLLGCEPQQAPQGL